MAAVGTILKIKRSSGSVAPSSLAQGELAYTYGSGIYSNLGARLFIGTGTETNGQAANIDVIGGKYFTDLLSGTPGTLTTNAISSPILDSTGTIDKWLVGNLQLTGNTISSTNSNGNINITPISGGAVQISGAYTLPTNAGSNGYAIISDGMGGSSWAAVSTTLNIGTDNSGSSSVNLLNQTLSVLGGNGIVTSISGQTLTISSTGAGGYTSTATGGTTTTLNSSSTANQFFTGTTTQTIKLPDTTTLALGQEYFITNNSTGNLTIQDSTGGAITTVLAGTQITFTVASISTQTWVYEVTGFNSTTGTGSVVLSNSPSLVTPSFSSIVNSGTLTLPTSTDTLVGKATTDTFTNKTYDTAGTGNAFSVSGNLVTGYTGSGGNLVFSDGPTISGHPTIEGVTSTGATGTGNLVFNNSPTLVTPTLGVASATSILTSSGLVSNGIYSGTYTNGVILDYTSGIGRISVGTGDGVTFYNNADTTRQNIFAIGSNGAVTLLGGSITGTTAITINAGGTNSNINLVPTGTGTVDVGSARITSVAMPTQATDAANKSYVDGLKSGLIVKYPVRLATTGTNLSANASGSQAGKTLTNSGIQTALIIDSVPAVVNDRVLIKDQSTSSDNGIYTVTDIGSVSTNWVLTRATDFDGTTNNNYNGTVTAGAFVFVEEGTQNANNGYVVNEAVTDVPTLVVDTDNIVFVQFSGAGEIVAGTGLTKNGNTISIADGGVNTTQLADNAVTTIKITDGNVTNAKLQNSTISVIAGDSTSDTVSLGDTITILGDSNAISTTFITSTNLQIAARTATSSLLGVAYFPTTNFTVTDGSVAISTIDGGTF